MPPPGQAEPDGAGSHGPTHELVLSEVRHRFRNIVTVTQALVNQTLRDDVPMAQARELLNQRLVAMGTAVDLLLDSNWQPGPLRAVVHGVLAHQAPYNDRIRCDGPDVPVSSNTVPVLSLVLHELGTNAVKHGALSIPSGRVDLLWEIVAGVSGEQLRMRWSEHGGPAVEPPVRTGFGTRLITKTIASALGGQARLDHHSAGMTWLLVAPLHKVSQ